MMMRTMRMMVVMMAFGLISITACQAHKCEKKEGCSIEMKDGCEDCAEKKGEKKKQQKKKGEKKKQQKKKGEKKKQQKKKGCGDCAEKK